MEDVMIRYFQGRERNKYARDADEMFRLRARQFRDRLGWDVNVQDGREIDAFDEMNPLYVVCNDQRTGAVTGCLRYLPTTGPTMMRDIFDQYFDEPFDIESPLIWEGSRFAAEPASTSTLSLTGLCRTTFELMQGGTEIALMAGIEQVVGIFDQHSLRMYRRTGFGPEVIARSDRLPHGPIYIGRWDISEASLRAIQERSGIFKSVLETEFTEAIAVA
jgi:acyl homoserine lactone synthase